MSSLPCAVCKSVSEPLLESGLCPTCHGRRDETELVSQFAPTALAGTQAETRALADANANPFAGCLPLTGFRCIARIGGGGMGEVYRAEELSLKREVAVKRMKADAFTLPAVRRFAGEAALLGKVNDDRVVKLHQFVPDPNDPLIVMEYVPGESLHDRLKRDGRLPPAEAARLIAMAARGVHAAHRVGVIHRDLKPGNLLLTPAGGVKVVDFGLAKDLTAGRGNTDTGRIIGGTAGFVAPEQLDEAATVGEPADVWGLGACLYAVLTGVPPFLPGTANLFRVLTDDLTPPREKVKGVPADLDAVICRCLEKNPSKRYQSAAALADELEKFGRREPTEARPQPWAARTWVRLRRAPRAVVTAWAVAAVVIVAAVGAAAFLPFGKPQTAEEKAKAIQDEHRRELKAGRPVTLIGDKGLPRHHLARFGNPALGVTATGVCTFEVVGHLLLELLDDPGIDSYTVRAQIQQTLSRAAKGGQNPPGEGEVGLYIGYAVSPDGTGGEFATVLGIGFSDRDPQFNRTGTIRKQTVRSSTIFYRAGPDRETDSGAGTHGWAMFMPSETRPGEWRTIEYHATPTGFSARWSDTDAEPTPMNGVLVNSPKEDYSDASQHRVDMMYPGKGLAGHKWNSRTPLGIFAHSSALCVRNVVVTPDP